MRQPNRLALKTMGPQASHVRDYRRGNLGQWPTISRGLSTDCAWRSGTKQVIRQNLALLAVVIGTLVLGAIGGWVTLPIAVLGDEISEFVVIGSGLRMLKT